jgi:hypothetical protein
VCVRVCVCACVRTRRLLSTAPATRRCTALVIHLPHLSPPLPPLARACVRRGLPGRLFVCSRGLLFEPEDSKQPLTRFPYRYMEAAPCVSKRDPAVAKFTCTQVVRCKKNNVVGPYTVQPTARPGAGSGVTGAAAGEDGERDRSRCVRDRDRGRVGAGEWGPGGVGAGEWGPGGVGAVCVGPGRVGAGEWGLVVRMCDQVVCLRATSTRECFAVSFAGCCIACMCVRFGGGGMASIAWLNVPVPVL